MSSLPIRRRILGVDFGRARIGVAVSDELGTAGPSGEDDSGVAAMQRNRSTRSRAKKMWSGS